MTNEQEDIQAATAEKVADRRKFLKSAGITGLGLASAGIMAGNMGAFNNSPIAKALGIKTPVVHAAADLDLAILNFALNLEYLEAEFYTVATTGKRIADFGIGTDGVDGPAGPTTGGALVNINVDNNKVATDALIAISKELTYDEQTHVTLIRGYLGNYAVAKPAINLDALGIGFASYVEFLTLARAFEDVGMSAYDGAAPLITSTAILERAARIALTESNHSGCIRLFCALTGVLTPKLDATDVPTPPAGAWYFNILHSDALAVTRTTSQVLAIAYGNSTAGTSKGAFFPNGMNGIINTV